MPTTNQHPHLTLVHPNNTVGSCDHCGSLELVTDLTGWEGDLLCRACIEMARECSECGVRIPLGDELADDYRGLFYCPECYCSLDHDDSDWYSDNNDGIRSWDEKLEVLFYSADADGRVPFSGTAEKFVPYMGVELEVEVADSPTSRERLASETLKLVGNKAILKSDGSLDYGFEIVTQPMTLEAWHQFDWTFLDMLRSQGVRAWDTSTCGLHIHVGLTAFQNRSHFACWWILMHSNWKWWVKLAGRHQKDYASWELAYRDSDGEPLGARRAYGVFPGELSLYSKAIGLIGPEPSYYNSTSLELREWRRKYDDFLSTFPNKMMMHASRGDTRYQAINCMNPETVELRFWRPSMRFNTVMAALEATHASIEYTRGLVGMKKADLKTPRAAALKADAFVDWINSANYPFLKARIQHRIEGCPTTLGRDV